MFNDNFHYIFHKKVKTVLFILRLFWVFYQSIKWFLCASVLLRTRCSKMAKCLYCYGCGSMIGRRWLVGHAHAMNCGQMAGTIKISLVMKAGLDQSHMVAEEVGVPQSNFGDQLTYWQCHFRFLYLRAKPKLLTISKQYWCCVVGLIELRQKKKTVMTFKRPW